MSPTVNFVLLVILTCTPFLNADPIEPTEPIKTYIVHLTSLEHQPRKIENWYDSFLSKVAARSNSKPKMVHAYHHVITGFAAKMTADQAKVLESLTGVLSVRPEGIYHLQTTRTPYFLGLRQNQGLWKDSNYGKGVIIGVIDTGIIPSHPSFNDTGVPPPPSTWKGKCEVEGSCNNKLIGLRSFMDGDDDDEEDKSPLDNVGHGTHTSSTAAGNLVDNANVFGLGNGTASGMAPLAHIAMYKVCSWFGCPGSAILAGMDAAIEEGVHVMSLSLGGEAAPFYDDVIAVAAFSAIQKGIFVSCSAGNSGPQNKTLANEAPWILTVGASTTDRRYRTSVVLGNKKLIHGESLYQPKDSDTKLRPLVYPVKDGENNASCSPESLEQFDVKGKVVMCDTNMYTSVIGQGKAVKDAGGFAVIMANDIVSGRSISAQRHVILASYVGYIEGVEIKKYLNSTSSPLATIRCGGTVDGLKDNPEVTAFSSRGPSTITPGLLTLDVVGPGVDILAGWLESTDEQTRTKEIFKVVEGTSMSCPHLSGVAALLKSAHPDWSPAAIKSAIMTTASQVNRLGDPIVDQRGLPADVFALGSGHVNPPKAHEPGLVFDIQPDDYIPYLCGLGYNPKQIEKIVKKKVSCAVTIPEGQLNYPSFTVSLKRGDSKTYSRTVTNVGSESASYDIRDISVPKGVHIKVVDHNRVLSFTVGQPKKTYEVTFSRDVDDTAKGEYGQGHMTWVSDNGKYTVRTPFSFKFE